MPNRTRIRVSLPPECQKFVEAELASGRYQSASDVVLEGLKLLQEREGQRRPALDDVRRKVGEGLDAAERGDLYEGEEVVREILKESRTRRKVSAE
jgi:antitoxin ParD1/3/4